MPRLKRIKQESFTRHVVSGIVDPAKNITPAKAYQKVYGTSDRSSSIGASALLAKPDIRARIQETLEVAFPAGELRNQIRNLLQSKHGIYFKGQKIAEEPDNSVRLETLRTILRVMGAYKPDSTSTTTNQSVNFFMNSTELAGLSETVSELERLNRRLIRTTEPEHDSPGGER